jgi:maltooligosyltrehalose synthase
MQAGELKMFILSELLALRSQLKDLDGASFRLLPVEGLHSEHVVAVERECAGGTRIAVLVARQTGALAWPQVGSVWQDTHIRLSSSNRAVFTRVVHGGRVDVAEGVLQVADAFRSLPVEVMVTVR